MGTRILIGLSFIATLLWGTFLLAALGVYQRDAYQDTALALLQVLRAVVIAGSVIGAGTGIGMLVLRRVGVDTRAVEQWVFAAIGGTGLLGTLWLWMGLLVLPAPWVTLLLLGGGVALLWWTGKNSIPATTATTEGAVPYRFATISIPARIFIGGMMGLALLQALTPPTSFDALLYHLRLPELWLAAGNVFQAQKDAPFFFPVLVEAIYTPALQLGTDTTPQLIHWCFLGLTLALLWNTTRRFLPTVSPLVVTVLALSIQMIPLLAGWAYTDLFFAGFQLVCIAALFYWRETRATSWLVIAGLGAGLGMGVKYLGVFTPVLAIVMIGVVSRQSPRTALIAIIRFGLVVAVVAAPSYLRNFIATGNPVFPFALPSPYWDSFRAAWYAANGTGIGWSLPDLLSLPVTVTLANRDTSYFDGRPGPLIAMFFPLALVLFALRKGDIAQRRIVGWLLFFVAGYAAVWVLGIINSAALWQGRFLVLPLLLCCLIVAWGLTELVTFNTPQFSLTRVTTLFVGLWAGFALLIAAAELISTDPITGIFTVDRTAWERTQLPGYADLVIESQRLAADNRLLLWFEPRSYQMPENTQPDTLLYEFSWRLHRVQGDIDRFDSALCAEEFTHVAVYWRGADFLHDESTANPLSDAEYNALQTWRTRHTSLWKAGSAYELFALTCP